MISKNSRYARSELVKDDSGRTWIAPRDLTSNTPSRKYRAKSTDRVDQLAASFGIPPTRWWRLAAQNDRVDWFSVSDNEELTIPYE